jgi:hypothetical protein
LGTKSIRAPQVVDFSQVITIFHPFFTPLFSGKWLVLNGLDKLYGHKRRKK